MSKKSFFDTQQDDDEFDKKTILSTELPSSESDELKKQSEKHEFAKFVISTCAGILFILLGVIVFFCNDNLIENPIIVYKDFKVSAKSLTGSLFLFIFGFITIIVGRYKYTIKK